MAYIRRASIYIFLFLMACVDRVDLKLDGQANLLVVDGLITDQPGAYTVKLSRSLKFDNSGVATTYFVPEKGAKVTIVEQFEGGTVKVDLQERESGVYETGIGNPDDPNDDAMRGVVGRTYWVEILTADGATYNSLPETMLATSMMENLKPTLNITTKLSTTTSSPQEVWGFDMTIDTQDPPGETNYYRWKTRGIIEFMTTTENGGCTCYLPKEPLEEQITISDDKYVNGSKFTQVIARAPYERTTRFRAIVAQYSLTPSAFEYWSRIRVQQTNTGSIFDAAPARIVGNVTRVDKEEEIVLGYFGASAETSVALTFNRLAAANYRYPPDSTPVLRGCCADVDELATSIVPEGF